MHCYWNIVVGPIERPSRINCEMLANAPAMICNRTIECVWSGTLPEAAVWVSSPLGRAVQTAATMNGDARPILEAALAEQDFGAWQGKTWDEIKARQRAVHDAFWRDPTGTAPPGGESFAQVIARVSGAVERLTAAHEGADIVAVAHGGTIRGALAMALGLEPLRAMSLVVDFLSLTRIDHLAGGVLRGKGGNWRVLGVNWPPPRTDIG